jgi:hypothetical protein
MASSGDPSTFTFTMDAFPDYTRFNPTKKVLAAIQIISDEVGDESWRTETKSLDSVDPITGAIKPTSANKTPEEGEGEGEGEGENTDNTNPSVPENGGAEG